MAKGGQREGAGRKSIATEERTKEICKAVIAGKFGSLEKGIEMLLNSKSDRLQLFVYEHALGKPTEKHEIEANVNNNQIFEIAGQKIEF